MDCEDLRARVLTEGLLLEDLVARSQAQRLAADCLRRAVSTTAAVTVLRNQLEMVEAAELLPVTD
jgi:hypothetical protein